MTKKILNYLQVGLPSAKNPHQESGVARFVPVLEKAPELELKLAPPSSAP